MVNDKNKKMKKIILLVGLGLLAVVAILVYRFWPSQLPVDNQSVACTEEAKLCPDGSYVGRTGSNCEFTVCPAVPEDIIKSADFAPPVSLALERITKKPFGLKVSPQNSPVSPEKFSGYHTGVDFETFPSEANTDVSVWAVCSGKLLLKKSASGYGGVAVQACQLNGQDVTIIYGHLRLTSITAKVGTELKAGDELAVLGTGYSEETSGERKHLHLGIYQGAALNLLGYVQNPADLVGWLDAAKYLK